MASVLIQVVPFVHPAIAALALAAGLIPIAIHLVNRRRYRSVPWAAMSFLLTANRRSRRRIWLQNWVLMLVRIVVVVLLGLAIARPYVPAGPYLPLPTTRSHRVVLIDNSLSMNARGLSGQTRFEAARRCARDLVAAFPETDAVSLVTLADPAEAVVGHAAYDHRIVRERLASVGPTQRAGDTVGAVAKTLEILAESETAAGNRAVYLISDFPANEWLRDQQPDATSTDLPPAPTVAAVRRLADALADSAVDLNLIRVPPEGIDNVAATRLGVESPLVAVNVPLRLAAELVNLGVSSARDLTLQVRQDGNIVRREPIPTIEPGGSKVSTISIEFSTAGTHAIEVRAVRPTPDALEEDDARYLSVEVRDSLSVLLVDGRPGPTLLAGQAGFLATALSPSVAARPGEQVSGLAARLVQTTPIEPRVITAPEFGGEALPEYDIVVLCNVQRLAAEEWKRLERFVSNGGGLFVFAGDLVSSRNYNGLGHAEGSGVLPGTIGRPVLRQTASDEYLGFKLEDLTHPIVAEFAGHPDSGLFLARVDGHVPIDIDPGRAEVVLRYTNDEPALLASSSGAGRVLFCTTTANMDWNNLPAKGDYVSLMVGGVAFLSPRHGDHRNVTVGKVLQEPLAPVESSLPLRVTTSVGSPGKGRVVSTGEALAFEYGPVEQAGVYTLSVASETRSFSANINPRESDLRVVEEAGLAMVLDRPVNLIDTVKAVAGEPTKAKSTELASVAIYLVLALLFGELWLAMRFGMPTGVPVRRTGRATDSVKRPLKELS